MAMAMGLKTGKAIVRKGIVPAYSVFKRNGYRFASGKRVQALCRKVAAIKRQQPFPMPLGGVAVVDRSLRKREAVMGVGIDLDLGIGLVGLHGVLELVDDFLRRIHVGFRAAEIKLGLGLLSGEMRAVGLVGRQMGAVDRGRGLDAIGKMRGRVDGITPAHAVADGADDFRVRGRLLVGVS